MDITSCYKVGIITRPHGLKGEVTVQLEADVPNDIESVDAIFVQSDGELVPYFIEYVSLRGVKAFVKFEEIDSIDQAEAIAKKSLFLPKDARPQNQEGEFYSDEIIDFEVTDNTAGLLGMVTEVLQSGLQRLLVVKGDKKKEVLIPINGPFIQLIDKSNRKITVDLPEGFLDM